MAHPSDDELELFSREGKRLAARREEADRQDMPLLREVAAKSAAFYATRRCEAMSRLPWYRRILVALSLIRVPLDPPVDG